MMTSTPRTADSGLLRRVWFRIRALNPAVVIFHPLVLPFSAALGWWSTLRNSALLLNPGRSRYQGFTARQAINTLFYRTQWINLKRHGRWGTSPTLGTAGYSLTNFWHLSSLSSAPFSHAGAAVTLGGTLVMGLSHLTWLLVSPGAWVATIIVLLIISTTGYLMAFVLQNYHMLAWMWLPAAMGFLLTGHPWLSAIAYIVVAANALTPVVFSVLALGALAIVDGDPTPLLVIAPACLYSASRFLGPLLHHNLGSTLKTIGRLVGAAPAKARYRRRLRQSAGLVIYMGALYTIGVALIWAGSGSFPVLAMVGLAIFLVNQTWIRVADEQSVMVFVMLTAAADALSGPPSLVSAVGMIVLLNPYPPIFNVGRGLRLPALRPFDTDRVLKRMREFLRVVPGSRILFAFDDPGTDYFRIFDGYRVLLEAPLCAAALEGVHLIPDWYGVAETNAADADPFWGRSIDAVKSNLQRWNADFAIVYEPAGEDLSPRWHDEFDIVSEFDWAELPDVWTDAGPPVAPDAPRWWLLRPRSQSYEQTST